MKTTILATLVLLANLSFAQQASTFNFSANAVALPNRVSTIAGTDAGMALTVTDKLDLFDRNVLGSGNAFQYFGGGFNYRLPALSTKLNNASPTLDGLKFQFFGRASAGVVRINTATDTRQHYGFTAGGGVNYSLNGSWSFGGSVEYAKFPGYANNTYIVEVGPQLHF